MSNQKKSRVYLLFSMFALLLPCRIANSSEDGVCGGIDIRNTVDNFKQLENCTVIEGKLHILLIDQGTREDFAKISFPKLVEITGHLLLYRVYGLRTLRNLFPNLTVIRGQELFHNYALVAYEMPDLETLGLVNLTSIMRGAVLLEKNNKLCYVDTIDWTKLATNVSYDAHVFHGNKDEQECVNVCPDDCPSTTVDNVKVKRCWTSQDCQQNLDCPQECSKVGFCQLGTRQCCHKSCIGGCTGPTAKDCISCVNVMYKGQCEPRCLGDMYMFMERRCLLDAECINMSRKSNHGGWKLIHGEGNKPGLCVNRCPDGYSIDEKEEYLCRKCEDYCPKECNGKVVDSIDSAQQLTGCTKITGPLEIQIMGGSNIGIELEKSLGLIQEVTQYIKIVRSYALLSFDFFKSLKVIRGEKLEHNHFSLVVMDNVNLQELFPKEVAANLSILNGSVSFHFNRKLCYSKIEAFLNKIKMNFTKTDVSDLNNGDQIPCSVQQMTLQVIKKQKDIVVLQWSKFKTADSRQLLSYVINYREVTSKHVNIYQGRDACSETVWKTKDVNPDTERDTSEMMEILHNLKPWTMYAVYIQTYTLQTANEAAISKLINFTTNPDFPSSPVDLQVLAKNEGELHVTWKPPELPNGNVTHYIVYWQLQELEMAPFDKRDYCKSPIQMIEKKPKKETQVNRYGNHTYVQEGQCCKCPKSKKEREEIDRDRQIQIEFQNHLYDNIYFKSRTADLENPRGEMDKVGRKKRLAENDRKPGEDDGSYITYDVNDSKNSSFDDGNITDNSIKENVFSETVVYDTEIILPNLGHFVEYNIEVLACQETDPISGKKYCSNRALATGRTLPSKVADNINSSTVKVQDITNHTGEVILKWQSPPKPNGLIITFDIEYWQTALPDAIHNRRCLTHKMYRMLSGRKLQNLEPGNYTFQIRASSLAGSGMWTEPFFFYIASTEDSAILNETVIAITVISVLVVIIITIIIVWFVAKLKFSKKEPDLTTISMNPGYVPSVEVYIPDDWEVDRDKIKLIRELGQGSFGMVYEGVAKDIPTLENLSEVRVAVKTVNDNAGWPEKMNFLKEASIMKKITCHHVVKLLGVVSKGQPALVIMELMVQGDLKNYLRMHRPDEEDNAGRQAPTLKQILQMSGEIADGMAYLADKKFVHRDLAARNCMVAEDFTVKIGDFGMTRDIYETDYYRKGGKGLLPVRWMAPESLKDGIFITMSDVWSYGVVLWEMATLAAQPYQGLSNEEVLKYVADGRIMEKPDGCPDRLYELMLQCWRYRYKQRPTFKEIIEMLVPDLDPKFKDMSYFFSDENKPDGAEFDNDSDEGENDAHKDEVDSEYQSDDNMDINDESRIPFMSSVQPDLNHMELQRSPSGPQRINSNTSPCECVLLEDEMSNGHRNSTCSSPNSAIGYSDGSKGSSKSSNSSYTHINGIANGHIHMRVPRTTPC